jgi:MerR family transcriptional regulator, thiopeptide resistance regulator
MARQDRVQDGRMWRVGELARETGLTVRTLHHYDRLGLFSPLSRTEGGHRCYTGDDVRRLHRIVALRSLGISLEAIGGLLNSQDDPVDLLRRQLSVADERVRQAVSLRTRLAGLLESIGRKAVPSAEELLQLIEETVIMNVPLTPGQFAELRQERERRVRELSDEEFAALRQQMESTWKALSRREQEDLMEQRRRMLPPAAGGGMTGGA